MSSHQNTLSEPSTLSSLPFYQITNVELYNTLETAENHIKACIQDKKFPNHIQTTFPDNFILKQSCKYYTTEDVNSLNNKTTNTDIKLLHLNIRNLDAHYGELALHESVGGGYDFIALTEIGQNNLNSRRAASIGDWI